MPAASRDQPGEGASRSRRATPERVPTHSSRRRPGRRSSASASASSAASPELRSQVRTTCPSATSARPPPRVPTQSVRLPAVVGLEQRHHVVRWEPVLRCAARSSARARSARARCARCRPRAPPRRPAPSRRAATTPWSASNAGRVWTRTQRSPTRFTRPRPTIEAQISERAAPLAQLGEREHLRARQPLRRALDADAAAADDGEAVRGSHPVDRLAGRVLRLEQPQHLVGRQPRRAVERQPRAGFEAEQAGRARADPESPRVLLAAAPQRVDLGDGRAERDGPKALAVEAEEAGVARARPELLACPARAA